MRGRRRLTPLIDISLDSAYRSFQYNQLSCATSVPTHEIESCRVIQPISLVLEYIIQSFNKCDYFFYLNRVSNKNCYVF